MYSPWNPKQKNCLMDGNGETSIFFHVIMNLESSNWNIQFNSWMFQVPGNRNGVIFSHFCSLISICFGVQNDLWVIFHEVLCFWKYQRILDAHDDSSILKILYYLTWILSYCIRTPPWGCLCCAEWSTFVGWPIVTRCASCIPRAGFVWFFYYTWNRKNLVDVWIKCYNNFKIAIIYTNIYIYTYTYTWIF